MEGANQDGLAQRAILHVHTLFMELIVHNNVIQLVKIMNVTMKPENALQSNRQMNKPIFLSLAEALQL